MNSPGNPNRCKDKEVSTDVEAQEVRTNAGTRDVLTKAQEALGYAKPKESKLL